MGFIGKLGWRLILFSFLFCSTSYGQLTEQESQNLSQIRQETSDLNTYLLDFIDWYKVYVEDEEYASFEQTMETALQWFGDMYIAWLADEFIQPNFDLVNQNLENLSFLDNLPYIDSTLLSVYDILLENQFIGEDVRVILDILNENTSTSLSNIDDNTLISKDNLELIYNFLSSYQEYESLYDVLNHFSTEEITVLNNIIGEMGGIYDAVGGVSEAINNININANLEPIIANQETIIDDTTDISTYTYGISTNVESIAKSISNIESSRIDDNISYLTEQNVGNSQNTIDVLTEKFNSSSIYLTNLNASVDLSEYDYDFSQYTNISHQIDSINNDYTLTQTFSKTNDLVTAIAETHKGIDKVANDIKQSFGSRSYDSKISWRLFVENPIEVDLKLYCNYPVDFKQVWDFVLIILTTFSMVYFIRLIWE